MSSVNNATSGTWRLTIARPPQITGIENHPVKDRDAQQSLVTGHIIDLKKRFPHSDIFVSVENNLGLEASHCAKMIMDLNITNVNIVHQTSGKAGIHTTRQSKENWCYGAQRLLEDNTVRLDKEVTGRRIEPSLREFETQLKAFCRITNASGSVSFSGKAAGANDDMVMAFLIAVGTMETLRKRKHIDI